MKKRLMIGLISGAILGVVCIIGASMRSTETLSNTYLFAFWYNRLIIGLAIGLLPRENFKTSLMKAMIIALMISFAFYSSTNFNDLIGFLVGIVYGIIIIKAIDYFSKEKIT